MTKEHVILKNKPASQMTFREILIKDLICAMVSNPYIQGEVGESAIKIADTLIERLAKDL